MEEIGLDVAPSGGVRPNRSKLNIAIAGGSLRAASILRLLVEVDNIRIVGMADANPSSPAMRLAEELGVFTATDISELYQVPALDLIMDMSDDPLVHSLLQTQKPAGVEMLGICGSEMVWDLLVAKKRGEEQERLFVELQVAYDKIRGHERRVQASKEALEKANEELESRLAEIFFTHEFFKALTSFSSVDDVSSLIVDGCNGILGAEISCVYLLERKNWTLRLRAAQGRPEDFFRESVPVSETIVGLAFREGLTQQADVARADDLASWTPEAEGIRSQAALPLRSGDAVLGVLLVASGSHRELSSAEMDRLQVIANQSSLALQNALLHEELERLSVTDRLTELYNHGYFQQRLEEEIGRAARFAHPLALIMLDIDNFKDFNDRYLHQQGDDVLRAVSAIIRQNLRDMDVAARYGGEEFVIVLPETDAAGAAAVAERVRQSVSEYRFATGEGAQTVNNTISVGVASFPDHATTQAHLIEAADRAMYLAKRSGKNRVVVAG